jgi:hypothetical protein
VGGQEFTIEAFDALLRDLMTCELAVRGKSGDAQRWHLVGPAQQRLDQLAIAPGPWPAERTAYLNVQCAECRRRKLTWVRKDSRLCDSCLQKHLASCTSRAA